MRSGLIFPLVLFKNIMKKATMTIVFEEDEDGDINCNIECDPLISTKSEGLLNVAMMRVVNFISGK